MFAIVGFVSFMALALISGFIAMLNVVDYIVEGRHPNDLLMGGAFALGSLLFLILAIGVAA